MHSTVKKNVENPRQRLQVLCELIASPVTNNQLTILTAAQANLNKTQKISTSGLEVGNYGFGDGKLFLTDKSGDLYPVIGDIPVLIFPERIVRAGSAETIDLRSPQYHEAYTEMKHYNKEGRSATDAIDDKTMTRYMAGAAHPNACDCPFPRPAEVWIDALHDSVSQFEAYDYLAPLQGKRFLQLGGSGTHAIKALVGGTELAVLLTPMLQEAEYAKALAQRLGVAEKFYCLIAVGEELPFNGASFDSIYSGGCLHHMRTEMAFAEMHRVLKPGGRFSCVDPWKTLLHKIGTRIFGKREAGVFCRPIDPQRLAPISIFKNHRVTRHGPILRYVFLALEKFGLKLTPKTMMLVTNIDDRIGAIFGLTKTLGGSIVICGEK